MSTRQEKPGLPCLEWRQATPEDEAFIFELSYTTMEDYIAASHALPEEQLKAWMRSRNGNMRWFVAVFEGVPIGALAFSQTPDRINIDSIHVLPERQNQGLGTAMLLRVQQWADEQKLPVVLQVMKHNDAARRLYERLGFIALGEDERDYHLWRPFTAAETPAAAIRKHKMPDPARSHYRIRLTEWFRRLFFRSEV